MPRKLNETEAAEQRKRLRVLRAKAGIGQGALAIALGQSRGAVSNYESGRPIPLRISKKLHELYPDDWPSTEEI